MDPRKGFSLLSEQPKKSEHDSRNLIKVDKHVLHGTEATYNLAQKRKMSIDIY